ncbi:hypothetical protein GA0116948_10760 [Chitinophaga costaii]|uniref:Lipocalin-like domain-containing protein n=1 Tax=Chitinophaga costaii TaxID=1335309 RepID=A0A1C4E363_9BACT|nr:hypothetical protein [Chitinophaga costaii]PUZ24348.1 hypothetical protein DCM91_13035 [Chitinophaga costaii]SCC38029.1 hypothetical protein GA0116948_10760 [Chitinophaga costaii]
MKKIMFFLVIGNSLPFIAKAQLAATRWTASVNIPDPTPCYLQFDKDTLRLFPVSTPGNALESMSYQLHNDTITLVKLDGQSPCSVGNAAHYKTIISEKELKFLQLDDACDVRIQVLSNQTWTSWTTSK